MITINDNKQVDARELHLVIESKTAFHIWIKRRISEADLVEGTDFCSVLVKSTGGRPETKYYFSIDAAKEVALLERNEKGKELRRWLIGLSKAHEEGLAFRAEQIEALMDITKAVTLVSIQEKVEKRHFEIYNDKYSWHKYRANLLGYSTATLIEAMKQVNKKHKSIRRSLMLLDAHELIRTAVIDLMLALGKSEDYAKNVGNLCKSISEKANYGNIIWDDTKDNPLGINEGEVATRKELFTKKNTNLL